MRLVKKRKLEEKYPRYDLQIANTHNFIAERIVVHNTNCRIGLIKTEDGMQFMAGSHKVRRKQFDDKENITLYWQPLDEKLIALLEALSNGVHDAIVFGEIFGPGVQDLDYGQTKKAFRVFDITVNGHYLDWEEVAAICKHHGVPTVPLLYKGVFSPIIVEEYTYGKTTVSDQVKSKFKDREGCVVTPLTEQFSDVLGGRMILKSVSADYRDRKGAEDIGE